MKPGDRVVCIKTNQNGPFMGAIKGKIYTIYAVIKCDCGRESYDVGIPNCPNLLPPNATFCDCGRMVYWDSWLQAKERFAPLSYNSAHDELINKEIIKETSDVPIKEPVKEKA